MVSYNNAIGRYRQFLHVAGAEGHQEKKTSTVVARTFPESDPNHISSVITESDKGLLLSGEVAAFLTISSPATSSYATEASTNHVCLSVMSQNHRTSHEGEETLLPCHEKPAIKIDELALSNPPMFVIRCTEGGGPLSVQFPALSDEEKRSPMGALLCYVMGNVVSFNEMVMKNREATSHRETLSIAHEPQNSSSVASKQSPQHQDSDSTKEGILTHQ
uniref:Uncharacterized protein n=1 Tax=Chaetoceros debilis TaxID=122233 RepID=A0A7S3PU26_9STRA|eukprot:CAMPEP_0194127536 /NCGR_PEP_ID=MMETSP0150-20130528/60576_1 /TAXON_ID=122233 /ORGANISM="Chaetoceros debilis, Strain MM31A-1" /LENGTH=217 /DNA_ID=CAMNT_0038821467 /DNA_START=124 /DNA_END=777 /DNA_ORIENTATION=+